MKVSIGKILFFTVCNIVLFSCSSRPDSGRSNFQRKAAEIESEITNLRKQSDSLYRIVATRLQDDKTYKKASIWVPKFEYLETIEIGINNYIMLNLLDGVSDKGIRNTDVLYKKLSAYKNAVINMAPEIPMDLKKSANNVTSLFDSARSKNPGHFNKYLARQSRPNRAIILRATIYNLLNTQWEILKFCDAQTK